VSFLPDERRQTTIFAHSGRADYQTPVVRPDIYSELGLIPDTVTATT
jgi:hypothetical protein